MPRSARRTYLLFGALTLYVTLQFLWWAVLLMRKETEIAELALQVRALGGEPDHPLDASRAMRMITGEGVVFLVLLLGILTFGFGWMLFTPLVPAVALAYVWNTMGGPKRATIGP